jgi:hypothetical protein
LIRHFYGGHIRAPKGLESIAQALAHARQHKGVSFWKKFGRRLES